MELNKYLLVFASRGKSAKIIAQNIASYLYAGDDRIIDVAHSLADLSVHEFKHLIFVCPTYGDEEVEDGMEKFLVATDWSRFAGTEFSTVELGLYRGYDSSLLGAAKIIQSYLQSKGLLQTTKSLSLDSVPQPDLTLLTHWLHKNFQS